MTNSLQKIRDRFDSQIGGINGNIYAAEPLVPSTSKNILAEYQKGVEVWALNGHKSWLANGHNDTIPYLHRLLYQRSSIHNSAVNIIAALIYGSGLEFYALDEYMEKDQDGYYNHKVVDLSDSGKEELVKQAMVEAKNTNMYGYSRDASYQLPLYGGYYGIRDFSLTHEARTRLRSLRIEKYFNLRLGADREWRDNKFQSKYHFISNDWTTAVGLNSKPYSELVNEKHRARGQVYHIEVDDGMMYQKNLAGMRSHFTGRLTDYRDFYATPIYETLDALSYIDIDYMLSQKDFNDIQNGFALEHIIVRYRDPLDNDEQEKAEKEKEKKMFKSYKGFDAENTMMLWVSPQTTDDGKVDAPETVKIITIPNENNAERYNVLREERNIKILSAHNIITPETIGMPSTSRTGFSSQSEYLITALDHLYWGVVEPYQQYIVEDIQNLLFNAGIPVGVRFKANSVNYQRASDEILKYAYGMDEIREKKGDSAMTEEISKEVLKRIENQNNKNQNQKK